MLFQAARRTGVYLPGRVLRRRRSVRRSQRHQHTVRHLAEVAGQPLHVGTSGRHEIERVAAVSREDQIAPGHRPRSRLESFALRARSLAGV